MGKGEGKGDRGGKRREVGKGEGKGDRGGKRREVGKGEGKGERWEKVGGGKKGGEDDNGRCAYKYRLHCARFKF